MSELPYDIPNSQNFCGGNFADWLEVMLTDACNGSCAWCVEQHGWHPDQHASWEKIVCTALNANAKNIILLGGEPTLHPDLSKIIATLHNCNRNVYVTTNGSQLTPDFVMNNLLFLTGINISIHDYDLDRNQMITGIKLSNDTLQQSIRILRDHNIIVRLNCNIIKSHIDTFTEMRKYIHFAKNLGAIQVRFAELKFDDDNFIDLAKVCDHRYGLNDDPFRHGCNITASIDDIDVSFRQMCGLQGVPRPIPKRPKQYTKQVLYYDGKIYNGWQVSKPPTDEDILTAFLLNVQKGRIDIHQWLQQNQ